MNPWRWLTTPDPAPGVTPSKVLKLAVRVMLFALLASLISAWLQLTPLRPYLKTWWGSMLLVFALYLPFIKFFNIDTFDNRPPAQARLTSPRSVQTASALERRKEKNRYAGVKKAPPKYGGRR